MKYILWKLIVVLLLATNANAVELVESNGLQSKDLSVDDPIYEEPPEVPSVTMDVEFSAYLRLPICYGNGDNDEYKLCSISAVPFPNNISIRLDRTFYEDMIEDQGFYSTVKIAEGRRYIGLVSIRRYLYKIEQCLENGQCHTDWSEPTFDVRVEILDDSGTVAEMRTVIFDMDQIGSMTLLAPEYRNDRFSIRPEFAIGPKIVLEGPGEGPGDTPFEPCDLFDSNCLEDQKAKWDLKLGSLK